MCDAMLYTFTLNLTAAGRGMGRLAAAFNNGAHPCLHQHEQRLACDTHVCIMKAVERQQLMQMGNTTVPTQLSHLPATRTSGRR